MTPPPRPAPPLPQMSQPEPNDAVPKQHKGPVSQFNVEPHTHVTALLTSISWSKRISYYSRPGDICLAIQYSMVMCPILVGAPRIIPNKTPECLLYSSHPLIPYVPEPAIPQSAYPFHSILTPHLPSFPSAKIRATLLKRRKRHSLFVMSTGPMMPAGRPSLLTRKPYSMKRVGDCAVEAPSMPSPPTT